MDYATAASVYTHGRELAVDDLERWRQAVTEVVPLDAGTVLDVGAGTGIFARAWNHWGASHVVACEPSTSMRAEAQRSGLPDTTSLIAGRAEHLPCASASADVVWISTVIHHIDDLGAWAAETRRVLKPSGVLLVRNLFADLGTTSWLAELPGAERARRAFPSVGHIAGHLQTAGLHLVELRTVPELHHATRDPRSAATWIRTMRHADSLLLAFTDAEIAAGLQRLGNYPSDHVLPPVTLGLAVFRS